MTESTPAIDESTLPNSAGSSVEIKSENIPLDYNEQNQENAQSLLPQQNRFDIFISHASWLDKAEQVDGIQVLPGEFEFVNELVILLQEAPYNYRVYVDFINNRNRDWHLFISSLKASNFGVFICSPRYNYRFGTGNSFIAEECEYFVAMRKHGYKHEIPIIFGINSFDYDKQSPFFSVNFRIDGHYDDLLKSTESASIVKKAIVEKIDKYIKDDSPSH